MDFIILTPGAGKAKGRVLLEVSPTVAELLAHSLPDGYRIKGELLAASRIAYSVDAKEARQEGEAAINSFFGDGDL